MADFTTTKPDIVSITPGDAGGKKIGHFGFFRPEHRDTFWRGAAEWLQAEQLASPRRQAALAATSLRSATLRGTGAAITCINSELRSLKRPRLVWQSGFTPTWIRQDMIDTLIDFLDIDPRSRQSARLIWPVVEGRASATIDRFYQTICSILPRTPSNEEIERLKTQHDLRWPRLFDSQFDRDYVSSASLIGIRHCEMGLDCKWHVAGYARLRAEIAAEILDSLLPSHSKPGLVVTLDKYLALDMAISVSSYTSIWVE